MNYDLPSAPLDAPEEEVIESYMNCSQTAEGDNSSTCSPEILALLGAAKVNWTEFSVIGSFYLLVIFCGIAGNALAIIVVTRDRLLGNAAANSIVVQYPMSSGSSSGAVVTRVTRKRTCRYPVLADTLIFLCVSDLLVVTMCIPVRFARWFTFTWIFGELLCKTVFFLQYWCDICSILTLMFVTYQRYYVATHRIAVHRIWNARRRRACLILLTLVAAGFASPVLIGQKHVPVGIDKTHFWCITSFSSDDQLLIFEIYVFTILIVLPLITMVTAYACLLRKVSSNLFKSKSVYSTIDREGARSAAASRPAADANATHAPSSVESRQQQRMNQYRRMYQLSALSVFVYTLCWTPSLLDRLLSAAGLVEQYNVGIIRYMRMATTLLSYANACLNPVVYCFLSSQFRKSVMGLLRRRKPRRVGMKKSVLIITL